MTVPEMGKAESEDSCRGKWGTGVGHGITGGDVEQTVGAVKMEFRGELKA